MLRELNETLLKYSTDKLNEVPEKTQEDIQNVRNWILKQRHLKARDDDQWLVGFLRASKFSLEKVKNKLQLYYSLQITAPDVIYKMHPADESFQQFFKLGCCVVLPTSGPAMLPRTIMLRLGAYDPSVNHITDVICVLYNVIKILMIEDDISTVLGVKIIIDYKGLTANHWSQATPDVFKKIVVVCQDSMPFRSNGSHHMNMLPVMDVIFNIAKSFLNEKSRTRLVVHKQVEDLLDHFPKETIPSEYGGTGPGLDEIIDNWLDKIKEYQEFFQEEKLFGVVEDKKRDKSVAADDAFGADGSFRALQFD